MSETIETTAVVLTSADSKLVSEAAKWRTMVENYLIDSPELFEAAGEDLRRVRGLHKQIEDMRTEYKRPHLEAGRRVDEAFRQPLALLTEASQVLNKHMGKYQAEQERIAAERRREAERLAAIEREQANLRAAALAAQGRVDEAEAVQAQAELAVAPAVPTQVPKVAGVASRKTWKLDENIDLPTLIKFVAANIDTNPAVAEYLQPNTAVLGALAKAHKKEDFGVPGVRAVEVVSFSARAA